MNTLTKLTLVLAVIATVLLLLDYVDVALILLGLVVFWGCVTIGDK